MVTSEGEDVRRLARGRSERAELAGGGGGKRERARETPALKIAESV